MVVVSQKRTDWSVESIVGLVASSQIREDERSDSEGTAMSTTPDLCDAFPTQIKVAEPIFRNYGGRDFFGGRIVTIKCFEDNSKVRELVATPGHGKVLVIDGGGSLRCALLGDQLAQKAVENGWEGIVINGCLRDVQIIATLDLGVQALASHPRKTRKRGLGDIGVAVTFAGLSFEPGEWLYADANGVLVAGCSLISAR